MTKIKQTCMICIVAAFGCGISYATKPEVIPILLQPPPVEEM